MFLMNTTTTKALLPGSRRYILLRWRRINWIWNKIETEKRKNEIENYPFRKLDGVPIERRRGARFQDVSPRDGSRDQPGHAQPAKMLPVVEPEEDHRIQRQGRHVPLPCRQHRERCRCVSPPPPRGGGGGGGHFHWRPYQMLEKKKRGKEGIQIRGGRGSRKGCQNREKWEKG